VEREEVILYPHVLEKLRRAKLEYYSGHIPEKPGDKRENGEEVKREARK
jgi:hypothetical protein